MPHYRVRFPFHGRELPPLNDRVAAGAGILDHGHPGWADRVDLAQLNRDAVLGLLDIDYGVGLARLMRFDGHTGTVADLDPRMVDWLADHGFHVPDDEFPDVGVRSRVYAAVWTAAVLCRRERPR